MWHGVLASSSGSSPEVSALVLDEYTKILQVHPTKEVVVGQHYLRGKEIKEVIHDQTPPSSVENWYWSMSELASLVFGDMDEIKKYKAKIIFDAVQINNEALILAKGNATSIGESDYHIYRIHLGTGGILDRHELQKSERDDEFVTKKQVLQEKSETPVPTNREPETIYNFILDEISQNKNVRKERCLRVFQNDNKAVVSMRIKHSKLNLKKYVYILDVENWTIIEKEVLKSGTDIDKRTNEFIAEVRPEANREIRQSDGLLNSVLSSTVVQEISSRFGSTGTNSEPDSQQTNQSQQPDTTHSHQNQTPNTATNNTPRQPTNHSQQPNTTQSHPNQSPNTGTNDRARQQSTNHSQQPNTTQTHRGRNEPSSLRNSTVDLNLPKEPETVPEVPSVSLSFNDVELGNQIGSGGTADVTKAVVTTDLPIHTVAIKQPRTAGTLTADTIEQLLSEAETWSKLADNDYIVDVFDYGGKPLPWIAMEFMDGGNLADRVGGISPQEALWIGSRVARAVRHAHQHGVVHRDLKPENVLFTKTSDGLWDIPKVADWGLAKQLLEHSQSVDGLSPSYAAPEQFDSEEFGAVDHQTDIYATGMVVYTALVGEPPFTGSTASVMQDILSTRPTPPSEYAANLPDGCDSVILKALAKEKEQRYESILDLRRALEQLIKRY